MSVAVMKTKTELALVDQFRAIEGRLPGNVASREQRNWAMAAFVADGLPHRRIEAWKYTDLRAALTDAAPPTHSGSSTVTAARLQAALGSLAELDAHRVVFVDGRLAENLSTEQTTSGVTIEPLANALATASAERAVELLGNAKGVATTAQLNSAFATDGAVISVAPGTRLDRPLMIVHACADSKPLAIATRHHLVFGTGSIATVIEVFVGLDGAAASQINTATTAVAGDGSTITHIKVVIGHGELHLSNWTIDLGTETSFRGFQYTESPALARNDITVTYGGPGAKLDLSGAFLATATQHIDTTLVVDHAVPSCESRELFKCVLAGEGRGVFQGKIIVRQIAQKTDGKQMAQALMLSPDAEFDSKPELEIYADDVVCGHGATVIDIDQDQVFYLRARGIPLVEARAMLVEAFMAEALDRIEHEALREALLGRARSWLANLIL